MKKNCLYISIIFFLTFSASANEYKHNLYLSVGMPISFIANAFFNTKLYAGVNYDYRFERFSIGLEYLNSHYLVNYAQGQPEWRQNQIEGNELNLLIKYIVPWKTDREFRFLIGYGRGNGDGTFEKYKEKRVEVENINFQSLQLGFELYVPFNYRYFFVVQGKYATAFYNDARIPSYGNDDFTRMKSIPSIGVGVGVQW